MAFQLLPELTAIVFSSEHCFGNQMK